MHRSRAYLSVLLVLVLALGTATPAFGVTRQQAEDHAAKAAAARKKAADQEKLAEKLRVETAELDKKIDKLQAEADALDPQISEATGVTTKLRLEVAKLDRDVVQLTGEIDKTQAEYQHQQSLLSDRVESAYKQGTWYYLDILLGSSDFNDLITRTELVSRVIESNNDIARDLADTRDSLTTARVKLQRSLDSMQLKKKEAEQVEKRLRGLQASREEKASAQEAIYRQKSDMMTESKKNAARLRALAEAEERESARIESELSGRGGSGQFSGSMTWPTPGFTRVTAPFGWRICPFHGREHHPAIDIGRNADGKAIDGAAIVAAADGEVIYAGYRGGYGNTIMIDHGNGVVTLYAHQRSGGLKVGNGEKVTKGQRIGTVGSTGYSTGPHLHFEVRVNGVAKNPMNYL